jgi:hypothetical protein
MSEGNKKGKTRVHKQTHKHAIDDKKYNRNRCFYSAQQFTFKTNEKNFTAKKVE